MASGRRRGRRPTKYQPLVDFLAVQTDREVTLSFAAIEAIIGATLSVSTSNTASFWNTVSNQPQVRQWEEMGWHARFDRRNQCVHFTRNAEEGANGRG